MYKKYIKTKQKNYTMNYYDNGTNYRVQHKHELLTFPRWQ